MSDLPKGKIRLLAAGGAGINIAQLLEGKTMDSPTTFADIDITYVDTSKSNVQRRDIDPAKLYHIENKDGSGKIRRENLAPIKAHAKSILQKHAPGDLTIVISSASGGSGSVIAPLLLAELLKQGKAAIAVTIASFTSKAEVKNTLDTLKSYESIVKVTGDVPAVMAYFENNKDTPRPAVNQMVVDLVLALSMLFSRHNDEMDSQDLFNWLRYDRHSSFDAQLVALNLVAQTALPEFDTAKFGDVISVASLAAYGQEHDLPFTPEYHTEGFVTGKIPDIIKNVLPLHFFISNGLFDHVAKEITAKLKSFSDASDARVVRKSLLSDEDEQDDSGLVI